MNSSVNRDGTGALVLIVVSILVGLLVLSCYPQLAFAKQDPVKPRIVPGDGDGVGGYKSSESEDTKLPEDGSLIGGTVLLTDLTDPSQVSMQVMKLGVLYFYLLK